MSCGRLRLVLVACVATIVVGAPGEARAQSAESGLSPQSSAVLLDVPFIAQSADLCGGAALAMLRRYWGDPDSVAEDFAALVDPVEGGIRTSRLTSAAATNRWTALPFAGEAASASFVASQLARGRPLIALILDRPGVFHYVVVVAWARGQIVFHDPARAPLRTIAAEDFERRWDAAGRWLLLVLPPVSPTSLDVVSGALPATDPTDACDAAIEQAIVLASAGRLDDAEVPLVSATLACPDRARVWRELAGVRFLQRRWQSAERSAMKAGALDPADRRTWQLLGSTRFMRGDLPGTLRAWNRANGPAINHISVDGADRTPQPVVIGAIGLVPRQVLRADALGRAAHRLGELPVAEQTALRFEPMVDDSVTVRAAVVERPLLPTGVVGWAFVGGRAVIRDTLALDVAGPARSGELWSGSWRWTERRPHVRFSVATPAPGGLSGVATVEGSWEEQTYDLADGGRATHGRSRAGFGLADWATSTVRWHAGLALDRFDRRGYANLSAGVDRRMADDRISMLAQLDGWFGRDDRASSFGRATVVLATRSSTDPVPALTARAGLAVASAGAPLAVWPRAGTGANDLATLRAHPLHGDDIVRGGRLGRHLWFASVEHARPAGWLTSLALSWAIFADLGVTDHRLAGDGRRAELDVGSGLRVQVPGLAGTLGLDVAYGVGDGRAQVSVSVRPSWPGGSSGVSRRAP